MALHPKALTDVATLRDYFNDPSFPTARAERLINAYSVSIWNYCQRQFKPEGTPDPDKLFTYQGGGTLTLAPYEAQSISALTVDGVAWTLGVGGYIPEPREKTAEGTYLSLVIEPIRTVRYGPMIWDYEVKVTGVWGMPEIPPDVVEALLVSAYNARMNPGSFQTGGGGGPLSGSEYQEPETAAARNIPSDARALLEPYRRSFYGV